MFLQGRGAYQFDVGAFHGGGAVDHVPDVSHQLQEPLHPLRDPWGSRRGHKPQGGPVHDVFRVKARIMSPSVARY